MNLGARLTLYAPLPCPCLVRLDYGKTMIEVEILRDLYEGRFIDDGSFLYTEFFKNGYFIDAPVIRCESRYDVSPKYRELVFGDRFGIFSHEIVFRDAVIPGSSSRRFLLCRTVLDRRGWFFPLWRWLYRLIYR